MSYCLNPTCFEPQNTSDRDCCQSCGSSLRLQSRYGALKLIGQGGFGRTFLAEDEVNRSRCVIKQFFPPQWGTDSRNKVSDLFREEAVHLKELGNHPQIPTLLAYVEQDNGQYLIQEWIDGSNLEQALAEDGAFSESQIRELLKDLLPVLQFLHEHQIIHRDIKPANLIRRSLDRKLVLVDMGAAKAASQTALAKTGTVIGSAEYAAPEQTRGKAVFASDLYSLGVTCLRLLTQMSPFDLYDGSEGKWVWRDYLSQPVSDSLGRVLDKMLEGATRRRYCTVAELLQDLRDAATPLADNQGSDRSGWSNSPPELEREPERGQSAPEQLAYQSSASAPFDMSAGGRLSNALLGKEQDAPAAQGRNPATLHQEQRGAGANIKVLLGFLAACGVLVGAIDRSPPSILIGNQSELAPQSSVFNLIEPAATWNVTFGLGSLAFTQDAELVGVTASSSTNYQTRALNASTGEVLRSLEHACRIRVDALNSLSLDGKMLASACEDGTVKIWDSQQGTLIRTLAGSTNTLSEFTALAVSPDGKTIVTGGANNPIQFWDVQTGQLVKTLPKQEGHVVRLVISPDGKTLAARTSAVNVIQIWNWDGTLAHTLDIPSADFGHIAISSDNQTLVEASRAQLLIWNLETGKLDQTLVDDKQLSPLDEKITSIAMSRDNRYLFTGGISGNLYVWDRQQRALIRALKAHHDPAWLGALPTTVILSPNGKYLISAGVGVTKVWRVDELTSPSTESSRQ